MTLLTTPAVKLLSTIPVVLAALGCLKRIQDYLIAESFNDQRQNAPARPGACKEINQKMPADIEKSCRLENDIVCSFTSTTRLSTSLRQPVQASLNLEIKRAQLTMILGPVGSGKSTLLKELLGEVSIPDRKVALLSPVVGYCSQTPWLQNCSIRDNIIGPKSFDELFYQGTLRTCALDIDIASMPHHDLTEVGSRGLSLSGGQKNRIVSSATEVPLTSY